MKTSDLKKLEQLKKETIEKFKQIYNNSDFTVNFSIYGLDHNDEIWNTEQKNYKENDKNYWFSNQLFSEINLFSKTYEHNNITNIKN